MRLLAVFLVIAPLLFVGACGGSSSSDNADQAGGDTSVANDLAVNDAGSEDQSKPDDSGSDSALPDLASDIGLEDAVSDMPVDSESPDSTAVPDMSADLGVDSTSGCTNGLGGTDIDSVSQSKALDLASATGKNLHTCLDGHWFKITPGVGGSYIFLAAFFQGLVKSYIGIAIYGSVPKTSQDFDNPLFFHGGVADDTKGFATVYADLEANKTYYLVISGIDEKSAGVDVVYDFEVTLPCSQDGQCSSGLKSQVLGTTSCHPTYKQCSDCKSNAECSNNSTGYLCQKDAGCSCRTDDPSSCPSNRYCRDDLSGTPVDKIGFCYPK